MDKLIQTSSILYDKDIYDKNNEIISIKNCYNTPKILYNNYQEWLIIKKTLLDNIYNEISIIIDKEYLYMNYHGMTINFKKSLNKILLLKLVDLTKNEKWSNNISNILINSVDSFIMSLVNSNTWNFFYNSITKTKLKEIIFKNIKWQLCNDKYWSILLDNIPQFICKKCKKKDNYINYNNLCVNCE